MLRPPILVALHKNVTVLEMFSPGPARIALADDPDFGGRPFPVTERL